MSYVLSPQDLQHVLKLHEENRDGLAYRHIAECIDRDRGAVHPCVIDWLILCAEVGRKKSWAKTLGFRLYNERTDKLQRSVAENFFATLRKAEGLLPTMEGIVALDGMTSLRELGYSNNTLAALNPRSSSLQHFLSACDTVEKKAN